MARFVPTVAVCPSPKFFRTCVTAPAVRFIDPELASCDPAKVALIVTAPIAVPEVYLAVYVPLPRSVTAPIEPPPVAVIVTTPPELVAATESALYNLTVTVVFEDPFAVKVFTVGVTVDVVRVEALVKVNPPVLVLLP